MNRRFLGLALSVAALPLLASGCCSTCRTSSYLSSAPPVAAPAPCPTCDGPLPPRLNPAVVPGPPAALPGPVPPNPIASTSPYQPPGLPGAQPMPSGPPPSTTEPPMAPGGARLSPPVASVPGPSGSSGGAPAPGPSAQLYPPQSKEPAQTREPPPAPPEQRVPPAPPEQRMPPANEPADGASVRDLIPQFEQAKPKVANGEKPFAEGYRWLKDHGYRAVLHIHEPGEDEKEARQDVERAGLTYLSLAVSPRTLNREVFDAFKRLVQDENNLPLFVYDRDGSLTGGLWYLYYRLADNLPAEKAAAEAGRLGFRADAEKDRNTWLAIQKLLADQKGS